MIRIGDFSRLARVSIRTLRHYEEEGLLRPAQVSAQTGYRYYRADQLMVLQRIGALRDIGMSIAEIRHLLTLDRDEFSIRLSGHERHLEQELAAAATRLRCLQGTFQWLTSTPWAPASLVRVRPLPPIVAYSIRQRVRSLGQPVTELFERAERRAEGDRIDDSPFMIFFDSAHADDGLDIEVCLPVRTGSNLPGVRRIDGYAEAVCITFSGSYSQSAALVQGLSSWLDPAGSATAAPFREVYHRFGAQMSGYRLPRYRVAQDEAEFVTELQLPVIRLQR